MLAALVRGIARLWAQRMPAVVPSSPAPAASPQIENASFAAPLRYLIAHDDQLEGKDGEIFEVGYDGPKPRKGIGVHYCNLYDQTGSGKYGPYLAASDTAQAYGERVVDPKGAGWRKLLADQCHSAMAAGFDTIEWDNPDGYPLAAVLDAVAYAASRGLKVLAKNPLACGWDPTAYIAHPAIVGVIVERGAGNPADMDALRRKAGKPELPVWFVAFRKGAEDGRAWAGNTANAIRSGGLKDMSVTYSPDGEYTSVEDILAPVAQPAPRLRATPVPAARPVAPGHELAGRVVRAMQKQGYSIAAGEDLLNIVYVEDMNADGNPVADVPNTFDSVRMLLRVTDNAPPKIIGIWEATTQPGKYWTEHPMNAGGAARIAFGQYSSWIVGRYHDQEALIQDAPITVYRDPRRRYTRYGPTFTGMFGIHQHWGYDYPHDDLGRSSAGCLVGRRTDGHREFMRQLKRDARYRADHAFRFPTVVMHASTVA